MQFVNRFTGTLLASVAACSLIAAAVAHSRLPVGNARVMTKEDAARVLGGLCYVDDFPPCYAPAATPDECEDAVTGPNSCSDAFYRINQTYMSTNEVTPPAGQVDKFNNGPIYCYARTRCKAINENGVTACVLDGMIDPNGNYLMHIQTIAQGPPCTTGP